MQHSTHSTSANAAPQFFSQAHHVIFDRSQVNQVAGNVNQNYFSQLSSSKELGLQRLYEAVSGLGALHDSQARFPPPKCQEGTRELILRELSDWIEADSSERLTSFHNRTGTPTIDPPINSTVPTLPMTELTPTHTSCDVRKPSEVKVHWLYGPAGTGKSAIAQTLCERYDRFGEKKHLAASFFFSRGDSKRNNPTYLFLSIAYSLATTCRDSALRAAIDKAVQEQPGIFEASLEVQYRQLIVEPLQSLSRLRRLRLPTLIVIDGLDECIVAEFQMLVLKIITGISNSNPFTPIQKISLRFLMASRPEPAIRDFVNQARFLEISNRTVLDDNHATYMDIKLYLHDGFSRIHAAWSDVSSFPSPWPPAGVLDELLQRASGQFIYADTVLKYVGEQNSYPPERLDNILGLPVSDATAFADLDTLYC
ncbi:hypothetical protein D9758_017430 [Tetrapyrgos nigripes]|uniref:Nephrocystin 3-like N-terminal domain-containing protein n=1 Tax=Tetrapyrgos nigripes TaxID=182062 RepID=A0A8H5C252_9AGAR|nr:hypothetical protein D9758_017430 [Tetrapyrgos nigripes]